MSKQADSNEELPPVKVDKFDGIIECMRYFYVECGLTEKSPGIFSKVQRRLEERYGLKLSQHDAVCKCWKNTLMPKFRKHEDAIYNQTGETEASYWLKWD